MEWVIDSIMKLRCGKGIRGSGGEEGVGKETLLRE
jgi:hypothetical protein